MGTYRNPLLPGCHPDPSICRFGDRYVLVTSSFEYLPGLPVHVSDDLVHWRQAGHAIHRPEQLDLGGIPSSCGLYAPTVRVVEGRLVVVCTVVGPDGGVWPGRIGHFLVTADDPAGPWSDPIWIDGVGGFDPSITVDGDRVWLCGTRTAEGWPGRTEVWIAALDVVTGGLLTEPVVIWTGADARAVWAEGPHIVAHPDGGWMLVVAEGGTDLDHAVCVAYAEDIEGPYVGDTGNPRLTHRDLGSAAPIIAVGHADLVTDAAGGTWSTVLAVHPVDGRRGLLGRRTSLVPVGWEAGRPLFAPGAARVTERLVAEGVPDQRDEPTAVHDDFAAGRLDHAWNGVGRHPSAFARTDGGGLLLAGPAFLGRRLPAERTEVVMRFAATSGASVGLMLRVSDEQWLAATVDGSGRARVTTGWGLELALPDVDPTTEIEVAMRIADLTASVSIGGAEPVVVDVAALAPGPPRGFVGAWIGPVVEGEGEARVRSVALSW